MLTTVAQVSFLLKEINRCVQALETALPVTDKEQQARELACVVKAAVMDSTYGFGDTSEVREVMQKPVLIAAHYLAKTGHFQEAREAARAVAETADRSSTVGQEAMRHLGYYLKKEIPPTKGSPEDYAKALTYALDGAMHGNHSPSTAMAITALVVEYSDKNSPLEKRGVEQILTLLPNLTNGQAKRGIFLALGRKEGDPELGENVVKSAIAYIQKNVSHPLYGNDAMLVAQVVKTHIDTHSPLLRPIEDLEKIPGQSPLIDNDPSLTEIKALAKDFTQVHKTVLPAVGASRPANVVNLSLRPREHQNVQHG